MKTISFKAAKPVTADEWVQAKPVEPTPTKRFTIDVPVDLRRRSNRARGLMP